MGSWKLRRGLKDFRKVLWVKAPRNCYLSKDIEGTEEIMGVARLGNYVLGRGNQQCNSLIWEACLAHSRNSKGIVEIKWEREGVSKFLAFFFFNESDYKLLRLLSWGNNMIWFMFEKDCSGSMNNSLTDFKVGSQGGTGSQLELLEQFKWEVTVLIKRNGQILDIFEPKELLGWREQRVFEKKGEKKKDSKIFRLTNLKNQVVLNWDSEQCNCTKFR